MVGLERAIKNFEWALGLCLTTIILDAGIYGVPALRKPPLMYIPVTIVFGVTVGLAMLVWRMVRKP